MTVTGVFCLVMLWQRGGNSCAALRVTALLLSSEMLYIDVIFFMAIQVL